MELSPVGRWADLPEDIAVAVASCLQEADVCALGGCSRSWRRACDADCIWERLFRCRWPSAVASASPVQGWKALYISQHRRMAVAISNVVEFVGSSLNNESLESEYYLKAIADLALIPDIGFLDVQFFLFSRNHSAIINLIGLHYSIASLHVLPTEVSKALQAHRVAERVVCVNLVIRWFYGFRLPDEYECHRISLGELTVAEGAEFFAILNRGAVHTVFLLRISLVNVDK
ncbi:F-box domain containing protein isoform 1 [Zea mays]|uniref:F-box domain containing protein n=1 Tax=Zea mays TaxID=4577 RepID=B6UEF5_MAIZE|nr:F-box domain containing protein isoform 1 [Zea mays]ACG47738.1 F-box domain containing protein [Zea mays]AQK94187.1 F-box domain containing protein [Zea mays]|eukprot:NP_001152462.1 F-box domain containing protein [Zea mays]